MERQLSNVKASWGQSPRGHQNLGRVYWWSRGLCFRRTIGFTPQSLRLVGRPPVAEAQRSENRVTAEAAPLTWGVDPTRRAAKRAPESVGTDGPTDATRGRSRSRERGFSHSTILPSCCANAAIQWARQRPYLILILPAKARHAGRRARNVGQVTGGGRVEC